MINLYIDKSIKIWLTPLTLEEVFFEVFILHSDLLLLDLPLITSRVAAEAQACVEARDALPELISYLLEHF